MAFKLAGVSSASTGSGGVGTGVGGGGLSYEDFLNEWNWCWIAQDVEAAAELGRTLLERNRELESTVRKQQALIDDQTQEIEYLSKQNRLLRQAAESRLRLCEQLEASAAEADRVRADLHHQIDSQRHRHTTLKAHLEAAEERGDELQRLLDASRASEAQAKCQLRSFQQEQHRQSVLAADAETITTTTTTTTSECSSSSKRSEPTRKEEELATVCRLVNDLAEVEERFHVMQSDWMEEKRKRMQLEAQLCQLENEHQSSIDYNNGSCSSGSGGVSRRESTISNSATHYLSSNSTSVMGHHHHLKTDRSLSLSEELISADFASGQWRDAWDDSHTPLSLIGSVRHHHHHHHHHNPLKDEEESGSDSSSSGFSDENRLSSSASKATQTDDTKCPSAAPTTTIDAAAADYKTLFRQIFDVIQQNK